MVKMPSQAQIKSRYTGAIPIVPGRYKEGVNATTGFIDAAVKGQGLYEAKMQDPETLARRGKALSKLSDADWKNPASTLGAARIGPGMNASADDQARSYEPYRSALEGVSLPERTTDPIANIDNRVKPVVTAMVETKKAQLG